MNSEPEHILEPDEPGGPLSSLEAFLAWRKAHPDQAAAVENIMRRTAAGDYGELTPEVIEAAKRGIAANTNERAVQCLVFDMKQLAARVEEIVAGAEPRAQLPELKQMAEDLVNQALGLSEPYRSRFLPDLISLRDDLLKIEG